MHSLVTRIVIAAGLVALADAALAEGNTAFVHMEKVFQGYWKTALSNAAFERQKELYSERRKALAEEAEAIRKQRDEHREKALNIALSDEAREEHRKGEEESNALYEEKRKEYQGFMRKVDKDLQQEYLERRAEIVKELSGFIRSYAPREGYDMIMDVSGLTRNFIPVIIYYPEERDITEALLAELNRGHEDEVAPSAETEPAETQPEAGGGAAADE